MSACRANGDNELRIHDLRHEAISRVAEAGSNTPGGFSLVDLQHFSGHRDVRMLLRYAHLCTQSLAKRLDAAFASPSESVSHHGRRRLKSGASVTLKDILDESSVDSSAEFVDDAAQAADGANVPDVRNNTPPTSFASTSLAAWPEHSGAPIALASGWANRA